MNVQQAYQRVAEGKSATFRPRGNSMAGLVNDRDEVVVRPCNSHLLEAGDVVLVRVKGATYLHRVAQRQGNRLLIGNNRGGTNGWVSEDKIVGICVSVNGSPRRGAEKKARDQA